MITKQKIKKSIIILIFVIIFTISLIFHTNINYFLKNLLADKCKIVSNRDSFIVHFINVGQADAAAINFPDGKIMLIDSGSQETTLDYIDYIKENVINSRKNNYIDYLVLSHADMDHVGGTIRLLKNFKVGTIFLPPVESTTNGYTAILQYVNKNSKTITMGEELEIKANSYSIRFFEILSFVDTNNSSQLIKIEYKDSSFLFVGDIGSSVEDDYINKYGTDLDSDVLKVSHHGSNSSSSEDFLQTVSPKYAVISVGVGNDYGHPNYEVLKRIENCGAKTLRTDRDKDIIFIAGNVYDLKILNNRFYITNLSLNYANIVANIDGVLLICCVMIIIKKDKKRKNV